MSDTYNSKIADLVGKLNKTQFKGFAITISSTSTWYSVSKEIVDQYPKWRKEEDCHKAQIAKEGWFKFFTTYFWQNWTVGYEKNKYEVEAKA